MLEGRVLVTGAKGFLGSNLVDLLVNDSVIRKRILDGLLPAILTPFPPSRGGLDLRDSKETLLYFYRMAPDVVFHVAATVGGIGFNQDKPGTIFYDNMMMGLNVLEAARQTGTRKVIMVGTVCSYPKEPPVPFMESGLWDGFPEVTNAPYGIAKKALLVMGQAYRKEFGLDVIHLIPTNLYGPGDDFHPSTSHVIPAMISKIVEAERTGQKSVEFWGDGAASREFLHVRDCARAIAIAGEVYDHPQPMNLGSGVEVPMHVLASMIAALVGWKGSVTWNPRHPNGQERRRVSSKMAHEALDWQAEIPLEQGLQETIDWYKEQTP